MDIRFETEEGTGVRRAVAESPDEVVGWYLEQEVQDSQAFARELLERIEDAREGRVERFEETGNAHHLILTSGHARIECPFATPPREARVPLDEFERAVRRWQDFIGQS